MSDHARPAATDALLSPEEVARRCGLSRRAVYRAIERGELPASRLCSRLRVDPADLEAWTAANRVAPEVRDDPRAVPIRLAPGTGLRRFLVDEGRPTP